MSIHETVRDFKTVNIAGNDSNKFIEIIFYKNIKTGEKVDNLIIDLSTVEECIYIDNSTMIDMDNTIIAKRTLIKLGFKSGKKLDLYVKGIMKANELYQYILTSITK